MRSFLSTLFNYKVAYIPLSCGLLTLQTGMNAKGESRFMVFRDWYIFGIRVLRYQVFVR